MNDFIELALQNLINRIASDEEVFLLKQELVKGKISIDGNVNKSIVILGNGNKVEITSEALDRLNIGSLLSDVEILNYKTKLVLAGIYSKLANDIEINRQKLNEDFEQKFPKNRLLVIKGEAGAGKSAYAKIMLSQLQNHTVFAFKSDTFAKGSLKDAFPEIKHSFNELLNYVSQQQSVVVLVDSLEKLLEVENYDALREFLRVCQELNNIKIIITCRSFAWQQIVFDLHSDFPQYDFIDIPALDDIEINELKGQFPKLKGLFENNNVKQLLRKPFYLNILILHSEITDNEEISEKTFRKIIWERVVAKQDFKRASTFENIAVQRARSMSLYVKISNPDLSTLKRLLDDGIILSEEYLGEAYCPSHDIYEDLALIRYIERIYQERTDTFDFFHKLVGKEPAIRRAFRLWLNDQLWNESIDLTNFVTKVLDDSEIEQYWKDEIVIAILQSKYCKIFFNRNLEILKKDQWKLLIRFIHLLRTACQEPDEQLIQALKKPIEAAYNQWMYLKPNGPGWEVVIDFIYDHFDEIANNKALIFRLLVKDWAKSLVLDASLPLESDSAGKLLLRILDDAKNHYDSGDKIGFSKEDINEGLITLFKLCSIFPNEVRNLITTAASFDYSVSNNYHLRDYYKSVISHALSGLHSKELCKELPDIICTVAQKAWLKKPIDANSDEEDFGYSGNFDIGHDFGLNSMSEMHYFPAGLYKTPIRFLLYYHPFKALGLIVNIINTVTKNYEKSKRGIENSVKNITLQLDNGSEVIQTGDAIVWGMYRGFVQATPDLLQSILMSLESWLLELCQLDEEWAEKLLEATYKYLLRNSTSVATSAVLASVGIAYPQKAGKFCFPILHVKEFYQWDRTRLAADYHPLAPMDRDIPFAQEERYKSNNLPHRKNDLEILLTKLQVGGHWERVNVILDEFQSEVNSNDKLWKLALNRMDFRKYEIDKSINTPEENQVALVPKIDNDLVDFVKKNESEMDLTNKAASISNWSMRVFKNEKGVESSYKKWQEEYKNYLSLEKNNDEQIKLFSHSEFLAAIGIRDFTDKLNAKETKWCINVIVDSVQERIMNSISQNIPGSVIFIEPAIAAITQILSMKVSKKTKIDTKATIFLALLHLNDTQHEYPFKELRSKLWEIDEKFADSCFKGLLEYAKLHKQRKYHLAESEEKQKHAKAFFEKELKLCDQVCKEKLETDITDLSFDTHSHWYLGYAVQFIPLTTKNDMHRSYVKSFFNLLFQILRNRNPKTQNYTNYINTEFQFRDYLASFLLHQDEAFSRQRFLYILNQVLGENNKNLDHRAYEFVDKTIEQIIIDQEELNSTVFWGLMETLEDQTQKSQDYQYVKYLFLSIPWWSSTADDWAPLKNKKFYYRDLIQNLGGHDIKSVVRLLSGIGTKTLLPDGLMWLESVLNSSTKYLQELNDSDTFFYAERLILRAYNLHQKNIKSMPELRKSYLFLLDNLINIGSSLAFIIRERIISV